MTSTHSLTNSTYWQEQTDQYLIQGNYSKAATLYEQVIEAEPHIKSHYWHLGLMLLLQGQEAEAQTTWLMAMAEGEPEQVEQWNAELTQVLHAEAERQAQLEDYKLAWTIRQHMREISPGDINNLLGIIALSIKLETFTGEDIISIGIIELLQAEETVVDSDLLLKVLEIILDYDPFDPSVFTFAEACVVHAQPPQAFIQVLMLATLNIAYSRMQHTLASRFAELCLRIDSNHLEVLRHLAALYQDSGQYFKGIETARRCCALVETLAEKVFANHMLLRGLMSATGYWEDACSTLQQQKSLLTSLIKEWPTNLNQANNMRLFCSTFFLPYFKDEPQTNRILQNEIAHLCQENVKKYAKEVVEKYSYSSLRQRASHAEKKGLKIGYISHCLRRHSVGWIARWLLKYHDRERFQIYTYFLNHPQICDFLQQSIAEDSYRSYGFKLFDLQVLEQIRQDEIDVLVELDSITLDGLCEIMTVKSAPIQVTWLGWDASGLPSMDYYIADPYVLPDSAQDYYTEKIWRLPKTYVAVDGFEVGVPTLRREQLNIPSDAVVYFVGQKGYKRHPDNVRLQMRIVKEVPNSYLLIKGIADEELTKKFFEQIAEEEGIGCDRLRFLGGDPSEAIHRANLGIADVVLDTYPYNGATTTLETLWMGIPLVTRVGQQFAARNSYTMMVNAGVTEGIAWTDEEYVEWGVRLGKDPALRQQITWRLWQSRQTAPLWNTKQFARDMEAAYEQMWQRYVEAGQ